MSLFQTVMIWVMALIYGSGVAFRLVQQAVRFGFGSVFKQQKIEKPTLLNDPSLGTHGFLRLENVRIHYVASGPEDKPLMLFLHGFPEFWFSWRHQIWEFQKDYRVVAIDQRGYGDSDKPAGKEEYEMSRLLSDIKQVILALGYKSCVLVAHDWGGAVAWAFGRFFPDMTDKLIVMNCPPAPVFQKILQTNKVQMRMSWYMFFFQLPFLPELYIRARNYLFFDLVFGNIKIPGINFTDSFQNKLSAEEISAYKYTFSQPGAITPPLNWYRAAMRGPRKVNYDLDYCIPVLLIWGMKDRALCTAIPDQVGKDNPKITVKRVPEAGHFVQMDCPDATNKLMRDWLEDEVKI